MDYKYSLETHRVISSYLCSRTGRIRTSNPQVFKFKRARSTIELTLLFLNLLASSNFSVEMWFLTCNEIYSGVSERKNNITIFHDVNSFLLWAKHLKTQQHYKNSRKKIISPLLWPNQNKIQPQIFQFSILDNFNWIHKKRLTVTFLSMLLIFSQSNSVSHPL